MHYVRSTNLEDSMSSVLFELVLSQRPADCSGAIWNGQQEPPGVDSAGFDSPGPTPPWEFVHFFLLSIWSPDIFRPGVRTQSPLESDELLPGGQLLSAAKISKKIEKSEKT